MSVGKLAVQVGLREGAELLAKWGLVPAGTAAGLVTEGETPVSVDWMLPRQPDKRFIDHDAYLAYWGSRTADLNAEVAAMPTYVRGLQAARDIASGTVQWMVAAASTLRLVQPSSASTTDSEDGDDLPNVNPEEPENDPRWTILLSAYAVYQVLHDTPSSTNRDWWHAPDLVKELQSVRDRLESLSDDELEAVGRSGQWLEQITAWMMIADREKETQWGWASPVATDGKREGVGRSLSVVNQKGDDEPGVAIKDAGEASVSSASDVADVADDNVIATIISDIEAGNLDRLEALAARINAPEQVAELIYGLALIDANDLRDVVDIQTVGRVMTGCLTTMIDRVTTPTHVNWRSGYPIIQVNAEDVTLLRSDLGVDLIEWTLSMKPIRALWRDDIFVEKDGNGILTIKRAARWDVPSNLVEIDGDSDDLDDDETAQALTRKPTQEEDTAVAFVSGAGVDGLEGDEEVDGDDDAEGDEEELALTDTQRNAAALIRETNDMTSSDHLVLALERWAGLLQSGLQSNVLDAVMNGVIERCLGVGECILLPVSVLEALGDRVKWPEDVEFGHFDVEQEGGMFRAVHRPEKATTHSSRKVRPSDHPKKPIVKAAPDRVEMPQSEAPLPVSRPVAAQVDHHILERELVGHRAVLALLTKADVQELRLVAADIHTVLEAERLIGELALVTLGQAYRDNRQAISQDVQNIVSDLVKRVLTVDTPTLELPISIEKILNKRFVYGKGIFFERIQDSLFSIKRVNGRLVLTFNNPQGEDHPINPPVGMKAVCDSAAKGDVSSMKQLTEALLGDDRRTMADARRAVRRVLMISPRAFESVIDKLEGDDASRATAAIRGRMMVLMTEMTDADRRSMAFGLVEVWLKTLFSTKIALAPHRSVHLREVERGFLSQVHGMGRIMQDMVERLVRIDPKDANSTNGTQDVKDFIKSVRERNPDFQWVSSSKKGWFESLLK